MSASRIPSETRTPRMEPLARLPVFFGLAGKRAVIAGGNPAVAWKAELLAAAQAPEDAGRRIPKSQACDYYIGETEPVVCACFQVGLDAVREAVNSGGATSVADIGRTLRAGTNCGSCLPELKRIIVDERIAHPL